MKTLILPNWQHALVIVLITSSVVVQGVLGPGDKKKKTTSKPPTQSSSTPAPSAAKTPSTRPKSELKSFAQLIHTDVTTTDDIVSFHDSSIPSAQLKKFTGPLLGYVTPWNSHGYDISKNFAAKIDINSPVWLQIKRAGQLKYELVGTHDIDAGWMRDVRMARAATQEKQPVKIVPRILFEKLRMEDLHALNSENEKQALAKMLVEKAREYNFDGYVLEIYLQLGGHGKTEINHLVIDIAELLHAADKLLYLVIPPPIKNLEGKINL